MKFSFIDLCVCGKQECISVQTQLCELATHQTTAVAHDEPTPPIADVWCQPGPIKITFNPHTSKYKNWLLVLSICYHFPTFKKKFLSTTDFKSPVNPKKNQKQWFINRIHFTRALLENRTPQKIRQNVSLLSAPLASHLAELDGKKKRMYERVHTVSFLDSWAQRNLPPVARQLFQDSQKGKDCDPGNYVQAPVGTLDDAKLHLSGLVLGSAGKASINRKPLPAVLSSKKRPRGPAKVTPSVKKYKGGPSEKDPLYFIDAIASSTKKKYTAVPCTPVQGTDHDTEESPLKPIETVDHCRRNIVAGFPRRSRNFSTSLRAYRDFHHQQDPIRVDSGWLYPCKRQFVCISEGFLYRENRQLRTDHPQLCPGCLDNHQKTQRNNNERTHRSTTKTRQSPLNAMDDEEKTKAYKGNQKKLKRCSQSIKRLRQQLQKTPSVTIANVTDALKMVKQAYTYIASKKEQATKMILDTVIEMETEKQIPIDRQDDRDRYVEFIVSDIVNACKSFTGRDHQIRFHPIMANLAMNLYMGMKYEDIVDVSPFVFPTVRTIQRNREKIATHEGTDPKVYARVSEMSGFETAADMLVHWLFDEVKLTSGVMWNVQELKEHLEELEELLRVEGNTATSKSSSSDKHGIYCNQWLARNPFGATLLGEFFYNDGNLDGNEIMRQFLQVSTSASIAGLQTIGLVSDMGGSNDRFYTYLRDGNSIQSTNLWPKDHVVVQNPVDPHVNICTWGCSTHGLKNVRSQLEMSRRDGSGSRQFHTNLGIPFGWWLVWSALDRDVDRELKSGGNFRTTLSKQSVHLDSFSKMNASLAKQPFTEKTLGEQLSHCASVIGTWASKQLAAVKKTSVYKKAESGEKLRMQLLEIQHMDIPSDRQTLVASDLAYLEFAVTVHRMYIQRFMNKSWKLFRVNIDDEEEQLQDCLQYFERWRLGTAEYRSNDESITRKLRERFFLSTQTYRNMKFAVCGFFQYSRVLLNHPSAKKVGFVPSGHSNTSALESRFSMVKRSGLNDTSKYQYIAANLNSIATLKHKRQDEKSTAKKMKKGNTSYPAELIASERHESASIDFTVGQLIQWRKRKVGNCFTEWEAILSRSNRKAPAMETVLVTPSQGPATRLCKFFCS